MQFFERPEHVVDHCPECPGLNGEHPRMLADGSTSVASVRLARGPLPQAGVSGGVAAEADPQTHLHSASGRQRFAVHFHEARCAKRVRL